MVAAAAVLTVGGTASATIVPTVDLGTAGNFSVLGGETVTNTGATTLANSLGLSPGSSVTSFPPGEVLAPGTTEVANPVAAQAKADLVTAYENAAGRPIDANTPANLTDLVLEGGVYAGPDHSPLSLTGTLVLDGKNDPESVFIFQTNSTLITSSNSTVMLINGAQQCNVFWQVGSSATLGTSSVFIGNILALTSITVSTGTIVSGRALARNGEVTLATNTFNEPTCDTDPTQPTTTTSSVPDTTTSTIVGATTTGEAPDSTTTSGAPDSATFGVTATTVQTPTSGLDTQDHQRTSTSLPVTGGPIGITVLLGMLAVALGALALSGSKAKSSPNG